MSIRRRGRGKEEIRNGFQSERLRILTESDFERHFFEEDVEGIKQYSSRKNHFNRFVPVSRWLLQYKRSKLVRDVMLGITLAFVIAPKAMAHALLANVNAEHGVYTALFSTLTYGILGTCSLLSVGTCALPALLFGEALIASGLEDYESGISTLTFLTGLITLVMAIFRLERLTSFIPPCALSAFTTTAAFLIGTSQVKYMLGLHFKADGFVQTWTAVFQNISDVNVPTLIISIVGVLFLKFCKKAVRKWGGSMPDPSAIVLVLSCTLISALCDLKNSGVDVVGTAPTGIVLSAPNLTLFPTFISSAVTIAVINYVLATSIAKSMASKSETAQFDASQELRALSGVNLVGSFFGAFVGGGSFSGSAIIASMNGDTMMHNFVNSAAMFVVVMVLLPLLASLPKAVLGCIIVSALERLIDFSVVPTLYRVKFDDFLIWLITLIVTLFGGVQYGMLVAIAVSLLALVHRASKSSAVVELGRLRGTTIYRRFDIFPDSRRLVCRGRGTSYYPLRIYRLDSSIHFGNTEQIEIDLIEALRKMCRMDVKIELSEQNMEESKQRLMEDTKEEEEEKEKEEMNEEETRGVMLLSCVAVNYVDTAAISMLRRFAESCDKQNVRLYFAGWKANCRATLYRYAREIELREKSATTTPSNAPGSAMDRLTKGSNSSSSSSSTSQAATVPVRMNQNNKKKSSPLNPSRWFLALHDAVIRMNAIETNSKRGEEKRNDVIGKKAWRFSGHIARAFVRDSGNLVGRTPREVNFRKSYNAVIIRVFRGGNVLPVTRIGRVVLKADDELVLDIKDSFDRNAKSTNRDLRVELTHDTGGKLSWNTKDSAVDMLLAAHVVDDDDGSENVSRTTRSIVNQTVEQAGLRGLPGLFLVAIERLDRTFLHAVSPQEKIQKGDILWFTIIAKDTSSASRIKAAAILEGIVGLHVSERVSDKVFDRVLRKSAEVDPITQRSVHEHSIMVKD